LTATTDDAPPGFLPETTRALPADRKQPITLRAAVGYSMISSARARIDDGIVTPSVVAVFR
jgi:hypothetical protein